jgi:hypothetical protein
MSIITAEAKKMMAGVFPETESDLEEQVTGEDDEDDDDDVSERPLVIQSPRFSETFDSPPAAEGTTTSSIELVPRQTTTTVDVSPLLSERSPALTRMLVVFLDCN